MIAPNAKCVVNGKKINSCIRLLNDLLATMASEQFDVVLPTNVPGKRNLISGDINQLKQAAEDYDSERGGLGGPGDSSGVQRDQLV